MFSVMMSGETDDGESSRDNNGNNGGPEEADAQLQFVDLHSDQQPGPSRGSRSSVNVNAGMFLEGNGLEEDRKYAELLQAEDDDRLLAELLQAEEYGGARVTPEFLNSMTKKVSLSEVKLDKMDWNLNPSRSEYHESDDDSEAERGSIYEVLNAEKIAELMKGCIDAANSVLQLSTTTTRMLLNHYGWDTDKLYEMYFSGGTAGREQLFRNADVMMPPQILESDVDTKAVQVNLEGREEDCEICCGRVASSEMFGMSCGHRFCSKCWTHYITSQIGGDSWSQACIRCIAHGCKVLMDDETVMNFITDPVVKWKYQHQITISFVQYNRRLKWCPSPNCNYAVKMKFLDEYDQSVTCKCGHQFCFECVHDAHDPVSCEMLKNWLKKMKEDTASSQWIVEYTKDCPSCKSPIEKNGGCNHMQCSRCGKHFCWVCLGEGINHTNCNNYNGSREGGSRNKNLEDLTRQKFYLDRYSNHQNSLKLERKLIESVEQKVIEMLDYDMSRLETQFLQKAVETLCRCRRTLTTTYVFAFFVSKAEDNCQIEIFEANQDDLHAATERLSGFLENEVFPCTDLKEKQQKTHDLFQYCEGRRKALINHIQEGYKVGWWKFRD